MNTPLLTVPLGGKAHRLAKQFATSAIKLVAQEAQHQVGLRVYLNTLAVYAVHSYLTWQSYDTALDKSDSWHPVLRARWDVADLAIADIGKLECRAVWEGETALTLPPEVMQDRIGYLVVQFGEQLNQAKLLGFALAAEAANPLRQLSLANLHTLDALIDHLYRLEVGKEFLEGNDPIAAQVREMLETRNMSDIVVQLEQVYQNTPRIKWRYAGADILAGTVANSVADRELSDGNEKIQIQKLAKNLLDRLAELWENPG